MKIDHRSPEALKAWQQSIGESLSRLKKEGKYEITDEAAEESAILDASGLWRSVASRGKTGTREEFRIELLSAEEQTKLQEMGHTGEWVGITELAQVTGESRSSAGRVFRDLVVQLVFSPQDVRIAGGEMTWSRSFLLERTGALKSQPPQPSVVTR